MADLPAGLAGYFTTKNQLEASDARQIGNVGALSTILGHIQQQQQAAQDAPLKRKLLEAQTADVLAKPEDRTLQREQTKALQLSRLAQMATQAEQTHQWRMGQLKTTEEKAAEVARHNLVKEGLDRESVSIAGKRLFYDTGQTAAGPPAAPVPAAPVSPPNDLVGRPPAEVAAIRAVQAGQPRVIVPGPAAAPVPAAVAAPAPADGIDISSQAPLTPANLSMSQSGGLEGRFPPVGATPGTQVPLQNSDGSVSTERSITVTDPKLNGGRPTNIPSIWGGRQVSQDEAIQNAVRSGTQFQSFGSIPEAVAAAQARSNAIGQGQASIGGATVPAAPQMPAFTGSPKQIADAQNRWLAQQNKPGAGPSGNAPGDFTKTGNDFLQSISESDRNFVKKLANYEIDPKTLSTRGGEREKFLRMAVQFDPSFDQKNYNTIATAINRFGAGKHGDTVRSLNVAIEHMDTARKLGEALKNTDYPLFNRLANEIATQTGKSAPTNFNAVKEIVADEVVKGVIGGPGALADREAAATKIRAQSSPEQMVGVLNSWTELLGGQLKGLERQYEGSTNRKDFRERYMTQRARDAIDGGHGAQPASTKTRSGATVSNW